MKKLLSVLIILLLCFSLTACGGKSEIVGTWQEEYFYISDDGTTLPIQKKFSFNADGTGEGISAGYLDYPPEEADDFTYKVLGDKIFVKCPYDGFSITATYYFDGDKLMLTLPYNPDKPTTLELSRVEN